MITEQFSQSDLHYDPINNEDSVVSCLNVESVNQEKECHAHEEAHLREVKDHSGNEISSRCTRARADWNIVITIDISTIDEPLDEP